MQELEWHQPRSPAQLTTGALAGAGSTRGRLWEDGLTLALVGAAFLCVAANVQAANWVEGLPLLYPIGLAALFVAYALSRAHARQSLAIFAGLFVGATIVYFEIMAILEGGSLYVKTDHLLDRMYVWWSAVTQHGTSVDPLPVIVIALALTWVGSFLAAWAILKWRNAWLGLIPGGAALIWDSGFSDSQFSVSAALYLILGVLLVMRLRVATVQGKWERDAVPYPRFIALSVLNATFWATCALLAGALLLPMGAQSGTASSGWSTLTGPLTSRLTSVAGAFISINPDKGLKIHALKDALIAQGGIDPSLIPAGEVDATLPPDVAPFLRDQSYDQLRRDGWHINEQDDLPLAAGDSVAAPDNEVDPLLRKPVAVQVTVGGINGDRLLSVGQPLRTNEDARSIIGSTPADVSGLQAEHHLGNGSQYTVVGSVSAATVDQLRAAGTAYPDWVKQTYLQTSRRLPQRVSDKAHEITASTDNPYDAATVIETYLRSLPVDNTVPAAPGRQDPVDYFLFDAQSGNYDYHASAMTVMLRTLGIPARFASGYVVDPAQQQSDGGVKLTQAQAFAWPEVYFPSVGWVEFNPTPSQPIVSRPLTPQTSVPGEPPLPAASADGGVDLPLRSLPDIGDVFTIVSWNVWRAIALALIALTIAAGLVALTYGWEFRLRGLTLQARVWGRVSCWRDMQHAARGARDTARLRRPRRHDSARGSRYPPDRRRTTSARVLATRPFRETMPAAWAGLGLNTKRAPPPRRASPTNVAPGNQ